MGTLFGNKNAAGKHNMLKHGANSAGMAVGGFIGGSAQGLLDANRMSNAGKGFAGMGGPKLAGMVKASAIKQAKSSLAKGGAIGLGLGVSGFVGQTVGTKIYEAKHPVKTAINSAKASVNATNQKIANKIRSKL